MALTPAQAAILQTIGRRTSRGRWKFSAYDLGALDALARLADPTDNERRRITAQLARPVTRLPEGSK